MCQWEDVPEQSIASPNKPATRDKKWKRCTMPSLVTEIITNNRTDVLTLYLHYRLLWNATVCYAAGSESKKIYPIKHIIYI